MAPVDEAQETELELGATVADDIVKVAMGIPVDSVEAFMLPLELIAVTIKKYVVPAVKLEMVVGEV